MDGQFSRTGMLFGSAAMERLARAHVAVFGVGGVGGHAVEVLARSGVGAIDIIDDDSVCPTDINRQIIALHSTVGRSKVEVAAERIHDINPGCRVGTFRTFYLPANADGFDLSAYDYVVDCTDTISAKVELVRRCHGLGVPLLSCMGAANKTDATAFRVGDISGTSMDPIARIIRKKLRALGIPSLKVVYSVERPVKPDTRQTGGDSGTTQEGTPEKARDGKRTPRPVPASNAFVPAVAGLIAGGEVVKDIISGL